MAKSCVALPLHAVSVVCLFAKVVLGCTAPYPQEKSLAAEVPA